MPTFQFTADDTTILSVYEFAEETYFMSDLIIENREGIYTHGKVWADNKEDAKSLLALILFAHNPSVLDQNTEQEIYGETDQWECYEGTLHSFGEECTCKGFDTDYLE